MDDFELQYIRETEPWKLEGLSPIKWLVKHFDTYNKSHQQLLDSSLAYESPHKAEWIDTYSGLYFLIQGDLIVYVGKAHNIHNRIKTHWKDNIKQFEKVAIILSIPLMLLETVEEFYIAKLEPGLNQRIRYVSSELKQFL